MFCYLGITPVVSCPQFLRPESDVAPGGWLTETGSGVTLYASVDDAPSGTGASDYIESRVDPSDTAELHLTAAALVPNPGQITLLVRAVGP